MRASVVKKLLIVGAGPAGMQLAVTARERRHEVELWEREAEPGGQMRLSAALPTQDAFVGYLAHQERALRALGVHVRLRHEATVESIVAARADVVAIATGARARRPSIVGVDGPRVFDPWQLLGGRGDVVLRERVPIVAQDDHVPPLAAADWLAGRGHRVTLIHATPSPAPLLSRYTLGAILARLSRAGVEIVCMEDGGRIELLRVTARHAYSHLERVRAGFDSVVLACGGVPQDSLYRALEGRVPELHVLGDAFAPRRNVNATRQGWSLGRLL